MFPPSLGKLWFERIAAIKAESDNSSEFKDRNPILNKKMFKYIPKEKRMDVTELIKKIKSGKNRIKIFPVEDETWFDVGQWSNYKNTIDSFTDLKMINNE